MSSPRNRPARLPRTTVESPLCAVSSKWTDALENSKSWSGRLPLPSMRCVYIPLRPIQSMITLPKVVALAAALAPPRHAAKCPIDSVNSTQTYRLHFPAIEAAAFRPGPRIRLATLPPPPSFSVEWRSAFSNTRPNFTITVAAWPVPSSHSPYSYSPAYIVCPAHVGRPVRKHVGRVGRGSAQDAGGAG